MSLAWMLLLAAAPAGVAPICTDRPTKANVTCTVPPGRVQIETSVAGWSLTRVGGTRTELMTLGSSFAKLGLSGRSDLQIGFTPYARLTVKEGGTRARAAGVGDVVIRYKHRLTADGAKVQLGLIPFVKLPAAKDGLGNGKVEGGLAVPVSLSLGKATMTFGPELDLLADADGDGHHVALVNLVNLAVPVIDRLTLAGELWTNFNFDPAGTVKQVTADAALAYALSSDMQLDVGANVGLTDDSPDIELYAGLSLRF
jgi:hypothetical protein